MLMASLRTASAALLLLMWVWSPRVSAVGCRADRKNKDDPATITCSFGSDLRETRKNFKLERFRPKEPIPDTLVLCSWRGNSCSPVCSVFGVDFQNTFSDTATVQLPASSVDAGDRYRCSLVPSGGDPATFCQLQGNSGSASRNDSEWPQHDGIAHAVLDRLADKGEQTTLHPKTNTTVVSTDTYTIQQPQPSLPYNYAADQHLAWNTALLVILLIENTAIIVCVIVFIWKRSPRDLAAMQFKKRQKSTSEQEPMSLQVPLSATEAAP